jgi:DNA-binding transcriptional ArsR family regulator
MADEAATKLRLTDSRALRAVAHPLRLKLVGLLRHEGPLTATEAAERVGESPASCSFHLRQLAKYGFVEEAGGGRGRRRPWRATAMFTSWPAISDEPELAAATELLTTVIAQRYLENLTNWLAATPREPHEWQAAEIFGDAGIYVTAQELEALGAAVQELVLPYLGRTTAPERRPDGTRLVTFISLAFPVIESER